MVSENPSKRCKRRKERLQEKTSLPIKGKTDYFVGAAVMRKETSEVWRRILTKVQIDTVFFLLIPTDQGRGFIYGIIVNPLRVKD